MKLRVSRIVQELFVNTGYVLFWKGLWTLLEFEDSQAYNIGTLVTGIAMVSIVAQLDGYPD